MLSDMISGLNIRGYIEVINPSTLRFSSEQIIL